MNDNTAMISLQQFLNRLNLITYYLVQLLEVSYFQVHFQKMPNQIPRTKLYIELPVPSEKIVH